MPKLNARIVEGLADLARRMEDAPSDLPGRQQLLELLAAADPKPLRTYLDMLDRWPQRLVGWRTPTERLEKGILPSLAGAACLEPSETWVDVGSGAGLPGLALALLGWPAPGLLVEARRKRVSFLKAVAREVSLGSNRLQVLHARVEDSQDLGANKPEVLLARALARPQGVLELAERLNLRKLVIWCGAADGQAILDGDLGVARTSIKCLSSSIAGAPGPILRLSGTGFTGPMAS